MPTPESESSAKKHYSKAEVEAVLASESPAATMSCAELSAERDNDMDILQHLEDFPANQRAKIRAATLRDLQLIAREMRQQHCPED